MPLTESRLKSLAASLGADPVGVTTVKRLAEGPPSADPRYLLPAARSVISFAVALNEDSLQDFIAKKRWRPPCANRKGLNSFKCIEVSGLIPLRKTRLS